VSLIEIAGKYTALLRRKPSVQNNSNFGSDFNRAAYANFLCRTFHETFSTSRCVDGACLFSSTVAFKAFCGIAASVQLLRIAFLLEILSVYGLTIHLHFIARNVLLLWSTVFFFVFAACAIAWVRDRDRDVRADLFPHRVQVALEEVNDSRLRSGRQKLKMP
jgi:hypothetical protein